MSFSIWSASRTTRAALATSAILLTACSFLIPTVPRPQGKECMMVGATFRETKEGVGPEVFEIDGTGFATVSWYAPCPAEHDVPEGLAESWVAHWAQSPKNKSAPPFHALKERTWSGAENGVTYRYTKYTLFFHGCDFWLNVRGGDPAHRTALDDFDAKCQPTAGAASGASTASASSAMRAR